MSPDSDPPERPNVIQALSTGVLAVLLGIFAVGCPLMILDNWLRVPNWMWLPILLGPGAILGSLAVFGDLRIQRDHHRRRRGLCIQCGYDLRASPGERCPECGKRIRRLNWWGPNQPSL